jgi:hypothetical protein
VNDTLDEPNETVVVTISGATNATLGATTQHTYTINDDDAEPSVEFLLSVSNGGEGTSPVNLELTMSAASGKNITVSYSVGGTAT